MDKQILEQLRTLQEMVAGMSAAKSEVSAPVEQAPTRLMTDYDCLLICMADDVEGAIDRWNRSAKARAKAANRH